MLASSEGLSTPSIMSSRFPGDNYRRNVITTIVSFSVLLLITVIIIVAYVVLTLNSYAIALSLTFDAEAKTATWEIIPPTSETILEFKTNEENEVDYLFLNNDDLNIIFKCDKKAQNKQREHVVNIYRDFEFVPLQTSGTSSPSKDHYLLKAYDSNHNLLKEYTITDALSGTFFSITLDSYYSYYEFSYVNTVKNFDEERNAYYDVSLLFYGIEILY